MQPCDYAYLGEYGMPLDLRCGIELPGATQISIEARKPDGSAVTWPAAVHESTWLRYIVQPGDLNQTGAWRLQAHFVLPGGDRFGLTAVMMVKARWA